MADRVARHIGPADPGSAARAEASAAEVARVGVRDAVDFGIVGDASAGHLSEVKGGRAQVKIDRGYSVVVNDASLFTKFSGFAAQHLGAPHVHTDIHSSLIAEDFCFYGTVCPALYLHVGCQSDYPLHSNRFLPNEGVLKTTIEWMVQYFLQLGES